jgi:hypothetical protein
MKVGRVTLLRSAPGRSCDMMCMSTTSADNGQQGVQFVLGRQKPGVPLPCSGSMTVSSSVE